VRVTRRHGGPREWLGAVFALLVLSGCAAAPGRRPSGAVERWAWPLDPSVADSVRTEALSPAVRLHTLVSLAGPWRAAVLDIDLAGCVSLVAATGGPTAVGRRTTSALLAGLPTSAGPLAAVNADFFLFAPPGVPTGAHVERGTLISGPGRRPVVAFDAAGRPFIGTLRAEGMLRGRTDSLPLASWNRPDLPEAGLLDAAWGSAPDSTVGGRLRLVPLAAVGAVRRSPEGWEARYVVAAGGTDRAPAGDTLLLVRRPEGLADRFLAGDTVSVAMRLGPIAPAEAVGGFPLLVERGAVASGLASAGAASFRGLNPRTALGIGANGRRLLLVVIDGRQPAWSVGMTTEETARLMVALGAEQALNLDGGGSSAMAIWDGVAERTRLATRPSDPTGERAVGNVLAVGEVCGRVGRFVTGN
jgi:hypothetical protein